MVLHRGFGEREFASDLLVPATARDECEHLLLPFGQTLGHAVVVEGQAALAGGCAGNTERRDSVLACQFARPQRVPRTESRGSAIGGS